MRRSSRDLCFLRTTDSRGYSSITNMSSSEELPEDKDGDEVLDGAAMLKEAFDIAGLDSLLEDLLRKEGKGRSLGAGELWKVGPA